MISTERLFLRKMVKEDFDDLFRVFTDPNVMRSFGGTLFDHAQMDRWIQRNLNHQDTYGYGLFSVIHQKDGGVIGDCGLEHFEVAGTLEVGLGYDLRSDYWGQGLATEAALAVRDFAFRELALSRLICLMRHTNVASCRVAEKIGMVKERQIERGNLSYYVYALSKQAT
jgi:ribosomal-protein-alanine N-acetyltransferase